jgi:hypothetical protein
MTISQSVTRLTCLALATTFISGCGGGVDDAPAIAPVKGVVTLDGQPVTSGTITFVPASTMGTSGPASTAEISSDGTYTLAAAAGLGAVIGNHWVSVECPVVEGINSSSADGVAPVNVSAAPCNIPARYGVARSSGVTVEVKEGENDIPIELTSSPAAGAGSSS